MSSLYELTTEMLAIQQELLDSDGEMSETLEDYLDNIEVRIEDKVDRYCYLIRNSETFADSMKDEIDRMQKRRQSFLRMVERLKERLRDTLVRLERKKVVTNSFTVGYQKAGGKRALIVDDVSRLPDSLVKTEILPNNEAIRKALDAGEHVPGVRLDDQKTILRVR